MLQAMQPNNERFPTSNPNSGRFEMDEEAIRNKYRQKFYLFDERPAEFGFASKEGEMEEMRGLKTYKKFIN